MIIKKRIYESVSSSFDLHILQVLFPITDGEPTGKEFSSVYDSVCLPSQVGLPLSEYIIVLLKARRIPTKDIVVIRNTHIRQI